MRGMTILAKHMGIIRYLQPQCAWYFLCDQDILIMFVASLHRCSPRKHLIPLTNPQPRTLEPLCLSVCTLKNLQAT